MGKYFDVKTWKDARDLMDDRDQLKGQVERMLLDDETMNILMSVFFEFKEGSYDADGSDGDGKERTDEG